MPPRIPISALPRRTQPTYSLRNPSIRPSFQQWSRTYATRQPTRAGTFYRSFGSPIFKCFLMALFTYQVVYWGWMKLESIEEKVGKDGESRISVDKTWAWMEKRYMVCFYDSVLIRVMQVKSKV
jgi:hypothetical protein